ncbi:MAG TPA: adenylosuccinate synthase [Planctomycetota bacterium]|nr:adenylosuccinate synthase [Planctomycetota bacterium]
MPATVLVGLQWGDEGKAKVLDELAGEADIIVRYQGGSNAGHTVWLGQEKYAFHLVPSGVLRPGKLCLVGNGVVFEPGLFVEEVADLRKRGVKLGAENLRVSGLAHLVMPYHRLIDTLAEKRRGKSSIGTTGRGIGPAYADKAARTGLRVCDLLAPEYFLSRVAARLDELNPMLEKVYGHPALDPRKVADEVLAFAEPIRPMVADVSALLLDALDAGRSVLFEGAQGALLDIDFGTYPFVTSSNATTLGAAAGAGVPPFRLDKALGIVKAYTTRVGSGPFPTELLEATGEALRQKGGEFGTTTGRPRRCGWFDAVAVRYAARLNGVREAVLTKLDVLDGQPAVKIATAYRLDGRTTESFPADVAALSRVEPVYEQMPGWSEDTSKARKFDDLPAAARNYVLRLEKLSGLRFPGVSVGRGRDQTLRR